MATYTIRVNGEERKVTSWDPDQPLLYVLRNALGLTGTKFGCGLAQCGACTVLMGGEAVRSCTLPISAADGKAITTIEGLGSPDHPDPVQAAFVEEQAAQCGYCTAGMVMAVKALLTQTAHPSAEQVKATLAENLCRCGTHTRIIRAALRAAAAG
jgi:nicotinate dehydrogenase subunit A